MAGNLKKFVNPRFLKTIDPMLMRQLFDRHFVGEVAPIAFDDADADHRGLLAEYFDQPVNDWSEGLVADLHRIAELGMSHGLETILSAARRQQITLFEPADPEKTADAPAEQDPKHIVERCMSISTITICSRWRQIRWHCVHRPRWPSFVDRKGMYRQILPTMSALHSRPPRRRSSPRTCRGVIAVWRLMTRTTNSIWS